MSLENVATVRGPEESALSAEAEATAGGIWLRAFVRNRLAVAGLVVIVALLLFSFVGPLFYHTDQIHTRLAMETLAPGAGRPLGTDDVGYDELGRLMVGGQTTLEVAFGAAAVAVVLGVLWGATAGYFGGLLDGLMMRIVDALLAIPALLLLLFLATVFRHGSSAPRPLPCAAASTCSPPRPWGSARPPSSSGTSSPTASAPSW
jgi:ABC-type dipeptide/oligopeptide/nickel transport system permease subunit